MTQAYILAGFAGILCHTVLHDVRVLPRWRYRRVGPIHWLRFGRWQLSICRCRETLGRVEL